MTIQEALTLLNRPLAETLAFYHTVVFKGLLGHIPQFSTEGKPTVGESIVISPTSNLYMLSEELLDIFTQFALQDKQSEYEGFLPAPCMVIFKDTVKYGLPESTKPDKSHSVEGDFLNTILLEYFNSATIGFREIWNGFSKGDKRRHPNVFITTFFDDIDTLETEVALCDPSIILVFTSGDGKLFGRDTLWVDPERIADMNPIEKNRITTFIHHALLKKAVQDGSSNKILN